VEEAKVERGKDGVFGKSIAIRPFPGPNFRFPGRTGKKIAALTVDEVNRALQSHLDAGRLVIVRAGDFSKKAPAPK